MQKQIMNAIPLNMASGTSKDEDESPFDESDIEGGERVAPHLMAAWTKKKEPPQ